MNRLFVCLICFLFFTTLVSCASTGSPTRSGDADAVLPDVRETASPSAASASTPSPTPVEGQTPTEQRRQFKGVTDFPISPVAIRDPAFLTPIADDLGDIAAHLPEGFAPRLPFDGAYRVSLGYGFEARAWTHQTLGNANSANDFFAVDFATPVGVPIFSVAPGRILTAQDRTGVDSYGLYVVIDHGQGIRSIYAHLSELDYRVEQGAPEVRVEAGQRIGLSGTSGTRWPHLHFAMHKDSRISHSGCDVGGKAVVPEPLGGYYGIRTGHVLESNPDES